jgi:hypothetical protein
MHLHVRSFVYLYALSLDDQFEVKRETLTMIINEKQG